MEELNDSNKSAFREILDRENRMRRLEENYMTDRYYIGTDLGQAQDYTAICIARETHVTKSLHIVHLERFPLGTSYPDVVRRIKSLLQTPKLRGKATLIVDYTGCGRPVVDMIREAGLSCEAISITSGGKVHQETDAKGKLLHNYSVPKIDLVACLQVLMQNKKLEIAKGLQFASVLAQELKSFKATITPSGHTKYEADTSWREEGNDDLVLAVALACWYATKKPQLKVLSRNVRILRAMTSSPFH